MFCSYLTYLVSDCVLFPIFQLIYISIFLFALITDFRNRNSGTAVTRGEVSWQYLYLFYGFTSVVLLQLINTTEAFKGYKTLITLVNLLVLFYLCFYNSWFRNKIVGLISKSKQKTEL